MLIDTHCHLTYDELSSRIDGVLQRADDAGVSRCITIATTPDDARRALQLMTRWPAICMSAGIHPHEAGNAGDDDLESLADLHRGRWDIDLPLQQRIVAVGETGLDFHYDFAPRPRQEQVFRFQLELARQVRRPVIIHARSAEQRVCDILADYPELSGRVVFHCFSADRQTAQRVLEMGFWVSFTGVVTFRNAQPLREIAALIPADRFMIETDAPYLSPEPVRRQRPCEPALVAHTARCLSECRGESFDELAQRTTANAQRFFNLPEVCG
jgi:TatD DNase family protein